MSAYITELQTLIRRHGNLSREQQLSWLYRNLLPEYRQYIRRGDFHDAASLSKIAREYELLKREVDRTRNFERAERQPPQIDNRWRQAQTSTPENRPARPSVAADTARPRPPAQMSGPQSASRPLPPPPNQNRPTRLTVPFDPNVCWRCGETGHRRDRCTGRPKLFCSRCGKPDILTMNCPCRKPENC